MNNTDFGKEVKKKLVDIDQTQVWLCEQITARTGLFVDGSYLNRIYNGQRAAPKIVQAIREILDIPMVAEAQTEKQDGRGGSHGST